MPPPDRPIVAVIQARMASTRLPGKVLLPLAGAPLLQRLIERVRRARLLDGIAVATTTAGEDDAIESLCRTLGVDCFRGDRDDVLSRMLGAADRLGAGSVVRLTADNPMVGADLVDLVISRLLAARPAAVYAHNVDGCGFPFGLFVEVATVAALRQAQTSATAEECEHVTLRLRRNPGEFPAVAVMAPARFDAEEVTIDTDTQFRRVAPLFERLWRRNPNFGFDALLAQPTEVGP